VPRAQRFVPAAQWRSPSQVRGLRGERIAWAYLTACGWEVEAHRFRLGRHDLDLVARRGSLVAFVEVKTRRKLGWGAPAESVGRRKRAILTRVAECWRLRYGRAGDSYRFDVVAVVEGKETRWSVEHIEDAWRVWR
jgi:putative endonuclease